MKSENLKHPRVNEARLKILQSKVSKRKTLNRLKSFDPATLPICCVWDPCQHGWKLEGTCLVTVWFEGARVPDELLYEADETSDEQITCGDEETWLSDETCPFSEESDN